MPKIKSFNVKAYQKFDASAKRVFTKYLEDNGYIVFLEPFGKYDIDLGAKKGSESILVDVEVRETWKEGKFPFRTIHLPVRKEKFLKHIFPCYFVAFRCDLQAFVIIPGKLLRNKIIVDNKEMDGEQFFDVPVNECEQIFL